MKIYELEQKGDLGILRLQAGGANALNTTLMDALKIALKEVKAASLKGLVLTGYDRFFSAGLDLITIYEKDRKQVSLFVEELDVVFKMIFGFPKPIVAAINGAATAGGCILALACDYRIMAAGQGVFGLNEIQLGLPLPASALEAARFAIPPQNLAFVLYNGKLFKAEEALKLGLVHEVASQEELLDSSLSRLHELTDHPGDAHVTLKTALRKEALDQMNKTAGVMREAFLDAWFDPAARQAIRDIRNRLLAKKQKQSKK